MTESERESDARDQDDRSPVAKGFALASSVLANALFVALAVALGYALDAKFASLRPWGMVSCAILGVVFFCVGVVSTVKRLEER